MADRAGAANDLTEACVPDGCQCACHRPGMTVSHVVACCGVTVKFNPFAFTIEENNKMIAKGWEPIINTGVLP